MAFLLCRATRETKRFSYRICLGITRTPTLPPEPKNKYKTIKTKGEKNKIKHSRRTTTTKGETAFFCLYETVGNHAHYPPDYLHVKACLCCSPGLDNHPLMELHISRRLIDVRRMQGIFLSSLLMTIIIGILSPMAFFYKFYFIFLDLHLNEPSTCCCCCFCVPPLVVPVFPFFCFFLVSFLLHGSFAPPTRRRACASFAASLFFLLS